MTLNWLTFKEKHSKLLRKTACKLKVKNTEPTDYANFGSERKKREFN
jgi:hypothetical protein